VKLEFLDIRHLPGIHPGFRIEEFSPAVNFITGPNASGKSSTIRALRYLLATPRTGDPPILDLMANFRVDGQNWLARREGSRIHWEIDGQPAERPALPDGDALGSYLVTVEDLFHLEGDNERHLAEQLRRELQQGYDLEVLRDGRYQIQPRVGNAEQRNLRERRTELHQVEARQREVSEQEKRLPQLAERIEQARAAEREVHDLETGLELVYAQRKANELETRRSGFPDDMVKLLGNESDRLDELEQAVETLQKRLQDQRRGREQARAALDASGLADGRPEEEELELQQGNINKLETVEGQLEDEQEKLAGAEQALRRARGRMQLKGADTERLPRFDPDSLRESQELAIELEDHEDHKRRLERQLDEADEAVDEDAIDRHQRAIHALQDWLSTPRASTPGLKIPTALAAGGALVALAGGLTAIGWLAIAGAVLMALAIAIPWLGKRQSNDDSDSRANDQLRAQDIDGPADWSRSAVQQRLGELERQLITLRLNLERHKRATEKRAELDRAEEALARLQERRHELAQRIGFDPSVTTRAMAQFLRDLETFHQASLEMANTTRRVKSFESRRAELQTEIQELLGQWIEADDTGHERAAALGARLRRLQERSRQAREAEARLERAESDIERLEGELEQNREKIDRLHRNVGLQNDQRRELEERLRGLEDWQELKRNLKNAEDTIKVKREQLKDHPDILAKARADAAEQLESELEEARSQAGHLGDLREEKGRIENSINRTGRDHAREKALAELSLAEDRLEAIRASVLEAEVAHYLLGDIDREHRRESEPPLLENAREFFKAFTQNQWDMTFIESAARDEIGFQARDLTLGEPRRLGELSTATRMQLLLALRMSQIALQEQSGPKLPLIIDEALTTSDHERASVIMHTLQQLADEQDRQVIYLAAGDYEYRLWEHATGKRPQCIDLAAVRHGQAGETAPVFELPERRSTPVPDGMNATEYAQRLQVPELNPRAPAESVHVFHLLPDRLQRLHQLLDRWRITTLGQLEALLESDAARHAIPDPDERQLLQQRRRITRDWIEAWRIGRGKPVDRAVLEQADGITANTIDRVSNKASELEQDARALIHALEAGEVHRYQAGQPEALKEWLLENGYLPDRDPLTAEQRRQRLLTRLADRVTPDSIHEQIDWLEASLLTEPEA